MDDDANPRVQTHGAAALVNFSEDCPKQILVAYIDQIMDKLEKVLSRKMKEVRFLSSLLGVNERLCISLYLSGPEFLCICVWVWKSFSIIVHLIHLPPNHDF